MWSMMNKSGITMSISEDNIVATKGAQSIGKITSSEKGKTVTIICDMNAAGAFVPCAFIFPSKRMASQ